jgi:elongation factor G
VSKILLLYASEAQEVDELPFGSVGVILGMKFTRTGDTLAGGTGKEVRDAPLAQIIPPLPVMSTSIIPHSNSDTQPVQEALEALSRTDPSVRLDNKDGQILIHGLGALHLEIVERRLRDEWDVNFECGKQRVSYREGLAAVSEQVETGTWKTDASGRSVELQISFGLRPLSPEEIGDEAWDGNVVVDRRGKRLPGPDAFDQMVPLAHIVRGIATTLSNSPHTALAMSHVRVQISEWHCPPGVNSSLLVGAAAVILRERIKAAGMGPTMEPYSRLRIVVHEDNLGKVVKDLTENGGEVLDLEGSTSGPEEAGGYPEDGVYVPPAWISPSSTPLSNNGHTADITLKRSIDAIAPLGRMLNYSTRLRALSGGHGTFEMSNAGFKEVGDMRRTEILREIGRA